MNLNPLKDRLVEFVYNHAYIKTYKIKSKWPGWTPLAAGTSTNLQHRIWREIR